MIEAPYITGTGERISLQIPKPELIGYDHYHMGKLSENMDLQIIQDKYDPF